MAEKIEGVPSATGFSRKETGVRIPLPPLEAERWIRLIFQGKIIGDISPSDEGGEANPAAFLIMYYVYILLNEAETRTYTGVTDDVNKRLAEHNAGRVQSSQPYRPYKVIHIESFETLSEARQKEKFYKSATWRRRLKEMLFKA